jgi:hypothetical protein
MKKKLTPEQSEKLKKYPDTQYAKREKEAHNRYIANRKKVWQYQQTNHYKKLKKKYQETHRAEIKARKRAYRKTLHGKKQHKVEKIAEKLPIAKECEFCGSTENLGRHHPDYRYPEIYVTSCAGCHKWAHKDQKPTVSYIRFVKE